MEFSDGNRETKIHPHQLYLVEYPPLRDEVNRTVDRMTSNEIICSAFIFSVVLFQFQFPAAAVIPRWIVIPSTSLLAVLVAYLGAARSRMFRRHMDQVDDYLEKIEKTLNSEGGWTTHYRRHHHDRATADTIHKHARQETSRRLLWRFLEFFALANLALQTAGVLHFY